MFDVNYEQIDDYIAAIKDKRIIGDSFNAFCNNFHQLIKNMEIQQYDKHHLVALVSKAGKFLHSANLEGKEVPQLNYSLIRIIKIKKTVDYNLEKINAVIDKKISLNEAQKKEFNPLLLKKYRENILNSPNNEFHEENLDWVLSQLKILKKEKLLDGFIHMI